MIFYTVYRTTNLINNKAYIGIHITENPYDDYLGSGKLLHKAIKKYGKVNFKKEILFMFDNIEDMRLCEKSLVNVDYILRNDTYNIGIGGNYGPFGKTPSEDTKLKISKAKKNKARSEEEKLNISIATKEAMKSTDIRNNLKIKAKNRTKYICEYCENSYTILNIKQFHGDRCKLNPNRIAVKSEDRSRSKVSDAVRLEIQERYKSGGITYKALAEIYLLSRSQIFIIVNHWYPEYTK